MSLQFAFTQFFLVVILEICAYLFKVVKGDASAADTRNLLRMESLRAQLQELAEGLELVRREMERIEQRPDSMAAANRALGPAIRIQAARLINQGESPGAIAAALDLPRSEVELLTRIQRLTADTRQPTS